MSPPPPIKTHRVGEYIYLALGSSAHYDEGIQVGWKVDMLRKRGNQDLTTCRLSVRDCAGLDPIVSLPHTPLYLETSMHFYCLEFPSDPMVFRFRGAILQRPAILEY